MIDKTKGISIGLLATLIPLCAGAVIWYDGRQDDEHDEIEATAVVQYQQIAKQSFAGDVELSLQQIELELKMFRMIKERRPLTADEEDRKSYLEALREIIVAEQQKQVA